MYKYKTSGTCSQEIYFDLHDGKVSNVSFISGCNGNLKGISKLVEGQDAQHIIDLLEGNTCREKPTSCPDQLAKALKAALSGSDEAVLVTE